jgi:nitroreductase
METWDALRSRRNVRQFAERPIPEGDLDRILEAGRRAPSASNRQMWDFVVVTGRERLAELAAVWQGARHVAGSAATIAMVAPISDDARGRDMMQFDLGQAAMCIMLTAADLGVGSGHAAARDQELARRLLGFPEDRFLAFMIALGYPADRPLRPVENLDRRPFDDVVHKERW